ncbi:MAG TPA: type II toxin-antitoxin system VapC family toxin [Candidatus Omnitrophota bacterium]|nr:type II toxin-antitoxin system VapC family toxin [Candidatus Omnitrophota bacterium]
MIVADANLIAYYYFPGPLQPAAQKILETDPAWFVPPVMISEFRNITLGFVRAKKLQATDASDLVSRVERVFVPRMRDVSSVKVMELAIASGCSAYDAEYVALAQMLKVKLVTQDGQLLKAFPGVAVSVDSF